MTWSLLGSCAGCCTGTDPEKERAGHSPLHHQRGRDHGTNLRYEDGGDRRCGACRRHAVGRTPCWNTPTSGFPGQEFGSALAGVLRGVGVTVSGEAGKAVVQVYLRPRRHNDANPSHGVRGVRRPPAGTPETRPRLPLSSTAAFRALVIEGQRLGLKRSLEILLGRSDAT
jgi:hypothetical protein